MARIKRKIGFSKRVLFAVMLSTAITLTLSSCMPLGSALQLSMEVEDLKDRVDYIEERTEIIRPATVTEVVKVDSKALEEVNKKISNLDDKLSQLDSKSVEFDNELSKLSSDLSQVKANVSKSTDKLSQYDSKFLQLDNKLSQYDSKVAQLTTNFSQLDSKLSQTMGSVSNLQKDNDANKSKINTLSTSLADVLNRVGSLEKSNNNLLNRINTIDSQVKQIDVIRKDLDILSSQLREVQGSIPTTISQSDVDFLKQLQQQIIELKNAIQSVDPVTLLRLDQGYIYYVVKSGDTLSTIANVYKTALSKITEVNGIKDP
ncbi:MAG: LysM peptidoglycan-binding domain-containing protein, partial [Fervidobacterium sp.]|nr:LysM peptidoglycan-binding domain-containing protein [Fervidobacterium sp.]